MAANWTAFVGGDVLTAAQLNGVVDNFADIAIFNETQASGTSGGTSVTGSFIKRVLNTTVVNNITGCSIASSVITLPAGTFLITANSPFFGPARCKIKLRNTTAGTDAIIGLSAYSNDTADAQTSALLSGTVTTTAATTFEVQYRVEKASAPQGLGIESSFSVSEIYTTIIIQRIA